MTGENDTAALRQLIEALHVEIEWLEQRVDRVERELEGMTKCQDEWR